MRFSQEYKIQNILKININIYFDMIDSKVSKFRYGRPNKRAENISRKLAQGKLGFTLSW